MQLPHFEVPGSLQVGQRVVAMLSVSVVLHFKEDVDVRLSGKVEKKLGISEIDCAEVSAAEAQALGSHANADMRKECRAGVQCTLANSSSV